MRDIVILACTEEKDNKRICNQRNYTTTRNKRSTPDRFEFKKYCRFCRRHTVHRETR